MLRFSLRSIHRSLTRSLTTASLTTVLLLFSLTASVCLTIAPSSATPPAQTAAAAAWVEQGKALYDAGQFADAIAVLQQAIQAYKKQGDSLKTAVSLSNLALVYQQLGQWETANQAMAESLLLLGMTTENKSPDKFQIRNFKTQNLPILAQVLDIAGRLQLEAGQAETAIGIWEQVASLYQQLKNPHGLIQSRIHQAYALRTLGYYRRALTLLTESRSLLQNQPSSLLQVTALRSLGNTLRPMGDLEQSREVLQRGLTIVQELTSTPEIRQEISALYFGLGNTARAQQDWKTASQFYQQAVNLATTSIAKIQAQVNLFSLLVEQQQSTPAQNLLPDIQTQFTQLPPSQSSLYAQIHFARSLMKLADQTSTPQPFQQAAIDLLTTVTQQAHHLGNRRAESYGLGDLGDFYEQAGQWKMAQTVTQQALNVAQALNAPEITYRWHWQLGRLLKQQGNIPKAIAAYDASVNELQSLRKDLVAVDRDVQFSFRDSVEPIYRESVELLVQSPPGNSTEHYLDQARQRIEALQLAELDNFFREACLDHQTVLLDQLVDRSRSKVAMIYPIILPNQLEVIIKLPNQPLHHHTIKITKSEVEQTLQQLQQNLTELDATATIQKLSHQVYRWLIQPIASDLEQQGVKTLVFVLDGALRKIPMAGLYDGKHYLVENYAVALSLGLQLFPPTMLHPDRFHVLAAGLVEPPLPFQKQFPPLPEIKSEFAQIAKAGIPTQQLLDQAFTSQALETQVRSAKFNIVHLATHGQFSSQAKNTFILAADGPINVTRLDSLLRNRTQSRTEAIELLVLSACQTAEGDDRATLGLAGVAVKAGARSTLASLWHIDDASTALLMGAFYRELANAQVTNAQVTKAEALRRAQVTLLKNYPNYSHVGFWAAYVLVGNWL
ncbi:CHAT domain-containing protein [Alkalinema sp. FACHB-956]|uniref:CHAT domain-containing protein n=1 Tax=Alkalinema sp. FACHB-956 TaxID=2692768 RepID=UPI0016847B0F|nr:CHAT domain-containing protein [Alkalinema sp. FACHB-956]MBD2328719.1 CHAT domain-containing protein [Alkalinema sp. FACHB-956]